MKKATQEDETLQILITVVQEGWPDDNYELPLQASAWPDDNYELPLQASAYFHCCPEIKMMVSECEICNKYKSSQQKELLMAHDPNESERPFQKIEVHLMSIGSREILITVDYYSSY